MKERIEYLKKNFPTIQEVIKFANPTIEEQVMLDYPGDSSRIKGALAFMLLEMVADAFNTRPDGSKWIPDWKDGSEPKWAPFFDMDSDKHPAGVGFSRSLYANRGSRASAGSRLSFEFEELSDLSAELFPELYITVLTK